MNLGTFEEQYKKLNSAQRDAVDSIDGPVMVVAGPGTGKTQVLALRIANILVKTDTAPSSILSSDIYAFRSFCHACHDWKVTLVHELAMCESQHSIVLQLDLLKNIIIYLDFSSSPKLLDDTEAIVLVDQLLQEGNWEYLRPRTDPGKYFR
jgi:hypothetical protein